MKIDQEIMHQAFTAFSQMRPEQINSQMEGMNKAMSTITGLIRAGEQIVNMFPKEAMINHPDLAQKMAIFQNYLGMAKGMLPNQATPQQTQTSEYSNNHLGNIFNK